MKRKVVAHGPATLIVSLPAPWVKKNQINKGDEIDITEKGNALIVTTGGYSEVLELKRDVSKLKPRLVDRFLARSYQKGYDKITLIHKDIELLKVIQTKVQELIGYEIIEQDDQMCVIQSVTKKLELDFDTSLRRCFLIIKEMLNEMLNSYKTLNDKKLQNLHLRDFEVNRLTYFCLRQITKLHYSPYESSHQSNVLYYIIEILEDLGDCIKKLAQILAGSKKAKKQFVDLLGKIIIQYENSYTYFYKPSVEGANKAYDLIQELGDEIKIISEKKISPADIPSLCYFSEISQIIYHFVSMRLDFLEGQHPL